MSDQHIQYSQLSDEDLMLSYRNGDAAAFECLYERHKGGLYRYFLRQTNNQQELANELFQELWMKLINAKDRYVVSAKFSTYLYRIAYNLLVDYWRRNQQNSTEQVDNIEDLHAATEPQMHTQSWQTISHLKQAIARLPEEQRSAFLFKVESELSLAEIADIMEVKKETIKSRIRYAVKQLKKSLHPLRSVL